MSSDASAHPQGSPEAWVYMGVVHPHGLRGELKVVLENESSTLRWVGLSVRLASRDGASERVLRVRAFRRSGALGFVSFEAIADRNAAEAVQGWSISVTRGDLPELGDDEVYLGDLVGLAVEQAGERVGVVERVALYPASSAAVVTIAGREVEIPIHEPYVEQVDLRDRVLRVAHLDDLIGPAAPDADADDPDADPDSERSSEPG